jgi:hypothetical protein
MFSDPKLLEKIAGNASTKHLLADPTFMQKLQQVQRNPKLLQQEIMQDQRLMSVMAMLLGINMSATGQAPGQDEPVLPRLKVTEFDRCVLHPLHPHHLVRNRNRNPLPQPRPSQW